MIGYWGLTDALDRLWRSRMAGVRSRPLSIYKAPDEELHVVYRATTGKCHVVLQSCLLILPHEEDRWAAGCVHAEPSPATLSERHGRRHPRRLPLFTGIRPPTGPFAPPDTRPIRTKAGRS